MVLPWGALCLDYGRESAEDPLPAVPCERRPFFRQQFCRYLSGGQWVILVNETAEHVVAEGLHRRGSGGRLCTRQGHLKIDPLVWPLLVVVADVPLKNPLEVSMAEDEHPVQAFVAHRPHPALGVGVGPGRSDRSPDDPDAFGAEHLV